MIKRMTALVLCLLLIAAVLPMGVSAAEDDAQQIRKDIQRHYYRALSASGKGSLSGYCGLLASYQLYFLGINEKPIMANGKDQYDLYKNLQYTQTGYPVRTYSASNYTLEEALNTVTRGGTQDAYNILVGFQSTATAAGSIYGHAMVIYAILDGMVYFTESFGCTIVAYEGSPSCCTIEEFCDYYDRWTRFEGIIVFGRKDYVDSCIEYSAHMFVQAQQSVLYSQPCTPDTEGAECCQIRTVAAGERLLVTGLYENTAGQFYYRVNDGGTVCYLPAEQAEPVYFRHEDITISDAVLPDRLELGVQFAAAGEITSQYSGIGAAYVAVSDRDGKSILATTLVKECEIYNLKKDLTVDLSTLTEGAYTYELSVDAVCHYIQDGQMSTATEKVKLCAVPFTVGGGESLPAQPEQAEPVKDGWVWEQGTWYYYEKGMPRTGWFCYAGVDYYLQADGSVTTGWAQINGKARFFSSTGAMRTGWLEDASGTYYLLSNGEAAKLWRTIEGKLYYFGEDGILLHNGWFTVGEELYHMDADGSVATGWVTLEDGSYFFHEEDGHLMAQAVEVNGEIVFRAYDPATGALTDLPTPSIQNATTAIK